MTHDNGAIFAARVPVGILVLVLSLAACAPVPIASSPTAPLPAAPSPPVPSPVTAPPSVNPDQASLESRLVRAGNPPVMQSDLTALAAGNRAFAADLYRMLRSKEGNIFFSPYSISLVLAMVYGGAGGATAQQMAETMHFTLPADRLHPTFNALDQRLASLGSGTEVKTSGPGFSTRDGFRLSIANSMWVHAKAKLLPAYLDLLAENYGAAPRLADFAGNPEGARRAINDWVSRQTEAKIQDLFPPGSIDASARLVLANAIYFKAAWFHPFSTSGTEPGPFHLKDGNSVNVPMMASHFAATAYERGDDFQAVGLPYLEWRTMMVIILPEEGKFDALEGALDADRLDAILKGLQPSAVILTMPKFKIESSFSVNQALAGLGMGGAFDRGTADFGGMDGSRDLYISQIIHKAFVTVDEKGTEAAAASGAPIAAAAPPSQPEVNVNRPFLFLIYQSDTGTILFVGRVLNPA